MPIISRLSRWWTPHPFYPVRIRRKRDYLRHVGKILDLYATATIPKISVVLREAYADAGGLVMGAAKGMGVDLCYAWPISRFAIEASTQEYSGFGGLGIEADAYAGLSQPFPGKGGCLRGRPESGRRR